VFDALDQWLDGLPWPGVLGLGIALTALAGAADLATDPQLSPVIFYIVPIAFAAWYGGPRTAVSFALLCAVVLFTADRLTGMYYTSVAVPFWNATTRFAVFLVTGSLIAGLRRALVHQRELALTDPLTRIGNRRWFYGTAETELARARRYQRPLTLAYIDLDNFKQLNDRSGHHVGDEALQWVADLLRANVRRTDLVSRFGGDEFTILLPETDQAQARMVFDKLRPLLVSEVERRGWGITCSIGVVTALPPPPDIDVLIRSADHLMYRAKRGSKDAVLFGLHRSEPGPDGS
jgi:diguanylate cyclase (GGDEF)-like protein